MVLMYRAALALSRGDVHGTVRYAQLAVDRAADGDDLTRAGAEALSGLASWGVGDLDAAHRAYAACMEGMRRVGHIADILGCSITLADIRLTQGRLNDAQATYDRALRLAADHSGTALSDGTLPGTVLPTAVLPAAVLPGTVLPGTADMYVGLSQVAFERDDLDDAAAHLVRSHELGERAGLPRNPYRWRVAMARVQEARGDLAASWALLEEAQAVYTADFAPNVRPVHSVRARMLATHGYVDEALAWAAAQRLSPDDELSYLHEHEHVTLARVLLTRHTADGADLRPATALLRRLLTAAEAGGRTGTVIEVLILQALAQHANGDTADALMPLRRALSLAEPEGYVRVFTGEGSPMAVLLNRVGDGPHDTAYVRRIADACRDTARSGGPAELSQHAARRRAPGIIEPLSERELDVLRLLSSDLDGPGIARHLSVSIHTVRSHTKNIYAKLGVNSRRAAVRRGHDLGLEFRTRPTLTNRRRGGVGGLRAVKSPSRSPLVAMPTHHSAS